MVDDKVIWKSLIKDKTEFCPFCKLPFDDARCICSAELIQYQTGFKIKNYLDVVDEMMGYAWFNRLLKRQTATKLVMITDRYWDLRHKHEKSIYVDADQFYITVTEVLERIKRRNELSETYGTSPIA